MKFTKCLCYLFFLFNFIDLAAEQSEDIDQVIKQHSHNVSTVPEFSGEFFTPLLNKIEIKNKEELVVKDIHTVWDVEKFKTPRVPIKIGFIDNQEAYTAHGVPRCIHLPIKLPNSDIRVPKEYGQFTEVLQKILDFEYSANSHFDEYYAYLTVDQGFIPRESYQRVPGPHVDGLPRDKENPRTVIDHAYLVANAVPTRFYFQPFDMSKYDLNKHHFFAIFRALADETQSFVLKPFEINLMNAYSIHTPEVSKEDVHRTIVRLEFSVLEFDREGNSINPAFANDKNYAHYPFQYVPRPIPSHLILPANIFVDQPVSSKMYTHSDFDQFGRQRLLKALNENPRDSTLYQNFEMTLQQISSGELKGIVIVHEHTPQGFTVFEEKPYKLNVSMIYTHAKGPSKEFMIYAVQTLKGIAGNRDLVFVEDRNNSEMIIHFERAANLAGVKYFIERF